MWLAFIGLTELCNVADTWSQTQLYRGSWVYVFTLATLVSCGWFGTWLRNVHTCSQTHTTHTLQASFHLGVHRHNCVQPSLCGDANSQMSKVASIWRGLCGHPIQTYHVQVSSESQDIHQAPNAHGATWMNAWPGTKASHVLGRTVAQGEASGMSWFCFHVIPPTPLSFVAGACISRKVRLGLVHLPVNKYGRGEGRERDSRGRNMHKCALSKFLSSIAWPVFMQDSLLNISSFLLDRKAAQKYPKQASEQGWGVRRNSQWCTWSSLLNFQIEILFFGGQP